MTKHHCLESNNLSLRFVYLGSIELKWMKSFAEKTSLNKRPTLRRPQWSENIKFSEPHLLILLFAKVMRIDRLTCRQAQNCYIGIYSVVTIPLIVIHYYKRCYISGKYMIARPTDKIN